MGRKVFVSYKYADSLVQDLDLYEETIFGKRKIPTTARNYVNELSDVLKEEDHIYKGEDDGESMETLKNPTIGSKLGNKIFDSSVTIALISKGMKESFTPERDQWIPWEISYSLKQQTRLGRLSSTNGVIAVILPDEWGSYDYFITRDNECNCRRLETPFLFQILKDNMFNVKEPNKTLCSGTWVYSGDSSYIQSVTWADFKINSSFYIDKALELRDRKDEFDIVKMIK